MSTLTYAAGVYSFVADDGVTVEVSSVESDRGHLRGNVRILGVGEGVLLEAGTGWFTDTRTREAWARAASQRNGHSDGDLANLLLMAAVAIEQEVAPAPSIPVLQRGDEFINGTDLESYYLVDRLFEYGDLIIVAAPAKAGKTILMMNFGLAVASGTQFLGRYIHGRSDGLPHKVAMLLAEDSRRTVARRMLRMSPTWPESVLVSTGDFALTERNYDDIAAMLSGFSVVIADPLLVVADIDDLNDAVKVRRGLTLWQRLARQTDAAVVLVHHTRKASAEAGAAAGHEMLGSQQLQATPDSFILMGNRTKGAPPGSKTLNFTGRNWPTMEPEVIQLDSESLRWEKVGTVDEFRKSADQEDADAEFFIARIYDALPPMDEYLRPSELAEKLNIAERKVSKALGDNPMYFQRVGTPRSKADPMRYGRALTAPVLAATDATGQRKVSDT